MTDTEDLAAIQARVTAGTPPADDPRWSLVEPWIHTSTRWSQGPNKYKNAKNGEAPFNEIIRGFFDRDVRKDLTEDEYILAVEKWKKKGSDERYKPTRARKDGVFVSGGILKDDSDAPNPQCPTNKKNFVNRNIAFVGRMLCYDVDGKDGVRHVERIRSGLRERQQTASIWSTHGHTEAVEKSRFVIFTSADIPTGTKEERSLYEAVYALIGDDLIGKGVWDTTCKNPARVIYLPSHNGVSPIFAYFEPGNLLDVAPYIEKAKKMLAEKKPAQPEQRQSGTTPPRQQHAQTPTGEYETAWLSKVFAKFADRLNLADFALEYCEEAERLDDNTVLSMCINTHGSGVSKRDDLKAFNAKDAERGIGVLYCFHDTCTSLPKPSGNLLDMIIVDRGITLARFLDFVDGITDAERADMLLPAGFGASAGQIVAFKREQRTGPDGEVQTVVVQVPICGLFMLKALARDEMSGGWGKEIEFSDADGRQKTRVVPTALVHADGGELFKELAGAGLWIASDAWERRKFKELLNTWETDERITDVSKPGWLGGSRWAAYMTPLGEIVGEVRGTYRLRDGTGAADRQKRGTLQGWKDGVGHAVWNGDTPQFAVGACAGVLGAIVQLADLDTIGFHFLGESGSGKTISQTVGASCVANPKPDKGVLVSGRSTDNSFESRFERGNGSSVHIDEAKTSNAKILELLIFMAASGVGKGRMRQDSTDRPAKTWSTCWTFSSEKPVTSILEGVGGEMVTGTAVRLLSIPMTDCPNIGKARADAIKRAAEDNYGHALPVFLTEIMKRRLNERPDLLRVLIDAYAAKLPATTSAAHRARQAFGVLWLAGELMKRCGLSPVDADVGATVRWAWDAYVGGAEMLDPKASNMRRVEEYLRTHVGTTVMRRGDDDVPRGEVIAWFDNSLVYLVANQVDKLPGVTLGTREVMKAFDDAGVLDRPQAGRNGLAWTKVPGHGAVTNYRLKMTLRPVETAEERAAAHTATFADNAAKMAENFRNAGAAADGSVH